MKNTYHSLKASLGLAKSVQKSYRKLQAHLDKQPVGFPSTRSGVELRLLQEIFTPAEAEAALDLTWRPEDFETLYGRARAHGRSEEALRGMLESMEEKGCIFVTTEGDRKRYSLHPLVVGMFEMQVRRLSPGLYLDVRDYMLKGFSMEYLSTEVPQMRVIPVNKAVDATQKISTYDEIRAIVEHSPGAVCIAECICKKGKDLLSVPCKATDRREVCLALRDFADTWIRHGWGREVTKAEALEILDQNERDGLMLISATMQEPQYVCSCCGCCCGIADMIGSMPRPADFAASNFQAQVESALCTGCEECVQRCQINAVKFDRGAGQVTAIDERRCIGCGVCVPSCPGGALRLVPKRTHFVPPKDHEALYETIMEHKLGTFGKAVKVTKALLGRKT